MSLFIKTHVIKQKHIIAETINQEDIFTYA